MSFVYKFLVFFIPKKTKEKMINYFSALLFNHQQKAWISDVMKVLDQKYERLASENVQQKLYMDSILQLV
ncbi:hypothetical protein, partial [Thalassotalea piscium]